MKSEQPYRPVPSQTEADAELERLAAQGRSHVQDESMRQDAERRRRIEWVRLWRLWGAMTLLPEPVPPEPALAEPKRVSRWWPWARAPAKAENVPAENVHAESVPAEAEFPPAEFDPGKDERESPPPPDFVESAVRKAHTETAWLASLPFAMERYFAVLAEEAQKTIRLDITISLNDARRAPSRDTLEGIVKTHDVEAEVTVSNGGPIVVRSCAMSGSGGYLGPYQTARIPLYVHGLVDKVLLPLHRSYSVARVSLARTT